MLIEANVLIRYRLRDSTLTPSKPKSLFFNTYATLTAITREASYATLPPWSFGGRTIHFAPLGPLSIILANLVVVLVFCFYKLDTLDQWKWEDVGYRTGFVAIAQLPLIFLLAGRQNIIGFLVGMSYERLNWFHRWVSRTLWLTTTIHMGFWFRNWGRYDYITYQLKNDPLSQRGFAAWIILTFIVLSSAAPVRRLSYEFFVLQHLVTFVGFIAAVWLHAPEEVKVWVWIPIGLLVFDRVARYAWATYANLSIFHPSKSSGHALWANRATFTPLPGNVTRITIENPGIRWSPGQHVFLTCHSVVPLQSHPFTIASIPEDNKMEFLVRAEKGGTRRFFRYASKHHHVLGSAEPNSDNRPRAVFLDGPYGAIRPLRQFDSVVLLAGGMGITFTLPFLRDLIASWKAEGAGSRRAVTKRIRFVWVIKSKAQLSWFETQLQSLLADAGICQSAQPDLVRELDLSIYITCDEKLEPQPAVGQTQCSQVPPAPVPTATTTTVITGADSKEKFPAKTDNKDTISINSVSPSSDSGCLPGGGCCCTTAIEDEDEITEHKCTCSGHAAPSEPKTQASEKDEITDPQKHKSDVKYVESNSQQTTRSHALSVLSGRPQPRTIIRKVLEKAEGESAVVVCGPEGLSDDVRRSVVYLSDDRAVHKGTGAQGIYLHVEKFGW